MVRVQGLGFILGFVVACDERAPGGAHERWAMTEGAKRGGREGGREGQRVWKRTRKEEAGIEGLHTRGRKVLTNPYQTHTKPIPTPHPTPARAQSIPNHDTCTNRSALVWVSMGWYELVWVGMVWYGCPSLRPDPFQLVRWYGLLWVGISWNGSGLRLGHGSERVRSKPGQGC
jgi:hypothetical protein